MGSPESDKQDIDKVFAPSNYESVVKAEPLEPDKNQTRKQWWDNSDQKTDIKNENSKDQIKTPKIKNKKWTTLKHNGVLFPPPYQAHGVKIKYKGKEVVLNEEQEEAATWFAALIETDHAKNPIFRKNFFRSWKKILGSKSVIKNLDDVDFKPVFEFLQKEKERKALLRKDQEVFVF